MSSDASTSRRAGGRPAAGTDPAKRRSILEGAGRVFSSMGFDAASMSDIAREACVSKPTLYVYFPNKEELFAAVCGERRDRSIAELLTMLDDDRPIEGVLTEFGRETLRRLSHPFVVSAHRIVIGVATRMPQIGEQFYEAGPKRLAGALARYLDHHVAGGDVVIEDTMLAAVQFLELCQVTIFRPAIYGAHVALPSEAEIARIVASAVHMFLAAYATGEGAAGRVERGEARRGRRDK